MAELYPTPTRLALLRDIANELVFTAPSDGEIYNMAVTPMRKVTSQLLEMYRVRWVEPVAFHAGQAWELDDAGRAVLDATSTPAPAETEEHRERPFYGAEGTVCAACRDWWPCETVAPRTDDDTPALTASS